jgi:DNA processing protein
MGKGRAHEIVLSLLLAGTVSCTKLRHLLLSEQAPHLGGARIGAIARWLGLSPDDCRRTCERTTEAADLCASLSLSGVGMVLLGRSGYPRLLREIPSPPPLLFYKGSLESLDSNVIAIVGSRKATLAGIDIAGALARELAALGFTIVSGLARGIDTAAHRGCLDAGGRTVAILGSGIDVIYPRENAGLAESISSAGAVVTELVPGTQPLRQNFPRRNRIISGLALGTVVVEAGESSGALITAGFALDQNRSVFAVPATPGCSGTRGTNRLLREGARLVETVGDILEEIYPQIEVPRRRRQEQGLFAQTDSAGQRVLELLSDVPVHVDELTRVVGIPSGRVLELLFSLEAKDLVHSLPGKFYVRGRAH